MLNFSYCCLRLWPWQQGCEWVRVPMSHPLLCECCGAATRKQCSKSSCLVPCWKSFIPWLLCGVAAALLPREFMPAVGHPRGGRGRPQCRHQGQECPGPLEILSVVWESPLAGSRPCTGEKKPCFIPLKNCSTWRRGMERLFDVPLLDV